MSKVIPWSEVRANLDIDEDKLAAQREYTDAVIRAYRLAEVREDAGVSQVELAERLGVKQPRVSALERGDLSRSELATIRAYIEALGGDVEVVAKFGDRRFVVA